MTTHATDDWVAWTPLNKCATGTTLLCQLRSSETLMHVPKVRELTTMKACNLKHFPPSETESPCSFQLSFTSALNEQTRT
jgi:hypothetical protein